MKKLRVLTMACFVILSAFLISGSAGAATTAWEVSHKSIISFDLDNTLTSNEEFGMYEYGNNSNSVRLLPDTASDKYVALTYDPSSYSFSNGFTVTASKGVFGFYYKANNGTIYYDLIEDYSQSAVDTYTFSWNNSSGIEKMNVKVHDIVPSSVPIPATALLFTSGFAGLIGFRRRKK